MGAASNWVIFRTRWSPLQPNKNIKSDEKGGRWVVWLVCHPCQWEWQEWAQLGLHPICRPWEGTELIGSTADLNPCAQCMGNGVTTGIGTGNRALMHCSIIPKKKVEQIPMVSRVILPKLTYTVYLFCTLDQYIPASGFVTLIRSCFKVFISSNQQEKRAFVMATRVLSDLF